MGPKARAAVATVFAGIAGLTLAFIRFYYTPNEEITNRYLLLALFSLSAGIIGINLITTAVQEYLADDDKNEVLRRIELLPGLIAHNSDLIIFRDRNTGYQYCIEACAKAKSVRNNILRYGLSTSADPDDAVYKTWLAAKEKSVESLDVPWKEIVSAHLDENDGQVKLSKLLARHGPRYYDWRRLDDRMCPMVQMTLFEFDNHSEVIFGWEFPGIWRGPSIMTRNKETVQYFEKYFDHCFDPKPSSITKESQNNLNETGA
jgi:hypothetical protein